MFQYIYAYAKGMAEYAKFNNVGPDKEDCMQSIASETKELSDAVALGNNVEIIYESSDVIHAIIKYFVIHTTPEFIFCSKYFWLLLYPMLIGLFWPLTFIVVGIIPNIYKLGSRYLEHECIRNHTNPNNRNHVCNFKSDIIDTNITEHILKIYYSVSVRGDGVSRHDIANHIELMQMFGIVLTKHLGQSSEKKLDFDGKTNDDIYKEDIKLLNESDIFIADITSPSIGVGYMISQALEHNKPVLCLYNTNLTSEKKISAMIAGNKNITIMGYESDNIYYRIVGDYFVNNFTKFVNVEFNSKKMFFIGPPGCGKSTLAKTFETILNTKHISTGQILRDTQHIKSKEIHSLMDKGQLISAEIMKEIVLDRLNKPDVKVYGYILDGYPPSIEDLHNLISAKINPNYIFIFDCKDGIAVERQCNRKERKTDEIDMAIQRVKLYHEKKFDIAECGPKFFPNTPIITVDANKSVTEVESFVHDVYFGLNSDTRQTKSYFPILPIDENKINSTRFHFHIDTENKNDLNKILLKIYARNRSSHGQIKVYPIQYLELGPQVTNVNSYNQMINFHMIDNSDTESFVTGRLGNYDNCLMENVLEESSLSGVKCMVELEEYVEEWSVSSNGEFKLESSYDAHPINLPDGYSSNKICDVPNLELHHGFNIDKWDNENPPIDIKKLMELCTDIGFNMGGWFIFKNDKHWSYRSNEFMSGSIQKAKEKLRLQNTYLRAILYKLDFIDTDTMASLEIVHGIWHFD